MPTANGVILPNQQPQTVIAMTGNNIQQGHNYPPNTNAMQNPGYNDPFGPHQPYGYGQHPGIPPVNQQKH